MATRYKGSILSSTAQTLTTSSAKGIWKKATVLQALKAGTWPPSPSANDIYFPYVPLLLHGDGTNGATNNTFIDSSASPLSITRNGTTTQGSFSPFGSNWSNNFNGTSDYFRAPANAVFNFGTGSFTVEAWVYLTTIQDTLVFDTRTSALTTGIGFQINSSGVLCYIQATSTSLATTALTVGTWNHVAWVFNGTSITGYVNGVAGTPSTIAFTLSQTNAYVGRSGVSAASFIAGYISNLRVTKGGALYTSGFTPSITPLTTTVSAGTVSLLTCQSNRFIDTSTNAFTLTILSAPSVQRLSPFSPTTAYSTSTIGGGGYFNGTTDYLSTPSTSVFGTTAFTIEGWFYFNGAPVINEILFSGSTNSIAIGFQTATAWGIAIAGVAWRLLTSSAPVANQWNHMVIARSGTGTNQASIWLNGVRQVNGTVADSFAGSFVYNVGWDAANTKFSGYMSSFRISNSDVYGVTNTTITVPTAPLAAITGTSLLLNYINSGVYDNAMMAMPVTAGSPTTAQISTAQSKFGGASMLFTSTSTSYLSIPDSPIYRIGTRNFTIEGWVYLNAVGVAYGIFSKGAAATGWSVNITSGNKLQFSYTATALTGATSLAVSTWYYFAVVRSGTGTGNLVVYLNGTADATSAGAVNDNFNQTTLLYVGANRVAATPLNGYIDDLRMTNGIARTIALPTQAFANQ